LKNTDKQRIGRLKTPGFNKNRGFSLFELVAFIISVAIIYAYAANRFAEFPAQAERASFIAVTAQLQTGINLELISVVTRGNTGSASLLEDINPMDLMLLPPGNYLGAFSGASVDGFPRRSWYFDNSSSELVYLVGDSTGVYLSINNQRIPVDEIRFSVASDYGEVDLESGLDVKIASRRQEIPQGNRRRRLNGVVLRPVIPFFWQKLGNEQLLNEVIAGNGG
jgi:type II secretory pathway pseudopilin PulG